MRRQLIAAGMGLVLACGLPVSAQSSNQPQTAPGVEFDRVYDLMIGDRAPKLEISRWLKGDEVTGFEKGRVYVVEFWATWCGPCIKGMPHLTKLQKEYKDKGVQIIGVNIWEREEGKVDPFMEARGDDLMGYTVAAEAPIPGNRIGQGKMAKNWMRAAGRNGIPSAFIVNQDGYVAWMGHPGGMDDALEQIVEGDWDLAKAAKDHADSVKSDKILETLNNAFRQRNLTAAAKASRELMATEHGQNAAMMNQLAWVFVNPDGPFKGEETATALDIAQRAAELSENKDPAILDTLAWAQFQAGDVEQALKTEQRAIDLLDDAEQKAAYEETLARMKEMAKGGA